MAKGMIVKLRRPESEKVLNLVVTEDCKVDVGTIAESLGLNPVSLKFNGLYISPGHNFISSVTWKTLLNYFANNGCSLNDPILVEGKSSPFPQFELNGLSVHCNLSNDVNCSNSEEIVPGRKRKAWLEASAVCSILKRCKNVEDDMGLSVNANLSNDVNCSNSEEIVPGSKRKAWSEDSAVCSMLKRCKTVHDDMDLKNSELGPNPLAKNRHFQDYGAEYVNCYSKRGRWEDLEETHPERKHSKFQYDLDVHSKTHIEKQKQQTWNGGNFPRVICNY